ncbi:MAG: C40 family peptidase [Angustibacter sp.]
MTTRTPGRHRAPARHASTLLPSAGSTGAVAKTSAVLAVSGGLVASLGLQAHAAPANLDTAATTTEAPTGVQQASAVPAALVDGVAAAPSFGEIGFTAVATKPKPKPKPKPVVKVQRSTERVSRSSERTAPAAPAAPVSIQAGAPGSAEFGAAVMAIASRYAGTPYKYGGTTPAGFDCSGYTSYVFRQVGIDLPRTSSAQRAATTRISRSEAMPGDLVFMPGHVGIYAGNGMMWDAPRTGKDVQKRAVYSSSATYGRVHG